jgi:valyl-tRNA synthetase
MTGIPKDYSPLDVESKWQQKWKEWNIYRFKREDRVSPTYVIDTPPPYPSGEFHMGTALNWTYIDIAARYKRMRGFNVFFVQGWDCHGLPTEVQVEKSYGIRKGDLPAEKFRELCIRLTEENIAHMRKEMDSFGFSIDWSTEYRTMDPEYYSKTQLSFLKLYQKGLIYRGEHPVNWCPRCETAIADAEVEYEERRATLSYIKFRLTDGGFLTIATTRPEFLPACVVVAVHPNDERYQEYVGRRIEVPPLGQIVEIIQDPEVDPEFGTGVVMVCTFGDKTDVKWVKRHKLPIVKLIDGKGRMTSAAGKYEGMGIEESRGAIIRDLKESGLVEKQEDLTQNVGSCWRCKTPVEILSVPQWFMRVMDLNKRVIEEAKNVRWIPGHMLNRIVDWAKSMDWDWVISRQRIFATPIPAWYCSACREPIVAREDQLPVIPWKDHPPVERCPKCGGREFEPEKDVLDTWMDSSITIAAHAGWPEMDERLFPADLQPNGTDIIRTWDYYLMVRHLALFEKVPYRAVLVNGMVVGSDGRKMSKSLGNYVDTTLARKKYGTDALRQWAAIGASTGSDIPFSWKDVEFGHRFMRKFWNAARFAAPHLRGAKELDPKRLEFRPVDKWILSRLNRLVKRVTDWLEDYQFNHALGEIHNFVWHEFCDMYVEEVKHRLYGNDPTADAARFCLYQVILTTTKMLAPFIPHFAEEVYQTHFASDFSHVSVHVSGWPSARGEFIDDRAEELGVLANSIISAIRQFKSNRKLALAEELAEVEVCVSNDSLREKVRLVSDDIAGTVRARELKVTPEKPELVTRVKSVRPDYSKLGPKLRSDIKLLVEALNRVDPGAVEKELASGKLVLQEFGKRFTLTPGDLKFTKETEVAGEKVEVIDVEDPPLTIIVKL